jgi:hypothetical protein
MLPQLEALYADDRPDLFLYDIAGAPARLPAERWGVPAVQLSPTFVAWDGYEQEMAPVVEAIRGDPRGADHFRRFTEWLTAQGSSITDGAAFLGRPARGLVLIPRAISTAAAPPRSATCRAGAPCCRSDGTSTRPPSASSRPPSRSTGGSRSCRSCSRPTPS